MVKNKIPENMTLDEASEFWDEHSFLDYDDVQEVHFSVDLRFRSRKPPSPEY